MTRPRSHVPFGALALLFVVACGATEVPVDGPGAGPLSITSLSSASVALGAAVRIKIHVEGGQSTVALAAENVPAGVGIAFDQETVSRSGDTEATLSAMPTALAGTYPLVLRATDDVATATAKLDFSVQVNDDFSIAVAPGSVTLAPGGSIDVGVSVVRRGDADGPITISATDPSDDVGTSGLVIPAGAEFGILGLSARGSSGRADRTLVVHATHPTLGDRTVPLTVHLQPASGSLDQSFGENGTVFVTRYQVLGYGDSALQPDGKVVVALRVGSNVGAWISVVRLLPDGSLDASFGDSGAATIEFPSLGYMLYPTEVAVAADGHIVVAGASYGVSEIDGFVARLLPRGAIDTGFGDGGYFKRAGVDATVYASSVRMLGGRIIVGGERAGDAPYAWEFWAVSPSGTLDTTFGSGGVASVSVGDHGAFAETVGGELLVAGGTVPQRPTSDMFARRVSADGHVDTTFGDAGTVTVDVGGFEDRAVAAAAQPDGRIVLVGSEAPSSYSNSVRTVAARLLPSGLVDTTFGAGGVVALAQLGELATSTAIQTDGRIVISGVVDQHFTALRLLADGTLDSSFGAAGRVSLPGNDFGSRAFVLPDGRLLFVRHEGSKLSLTRMWP